MDEIPIDGIYMASNVDASCRVYPSLLVHPEEITDSHGGCDSIRDHLGEGILFEKNKLYWITDRTPHETLPIRAPPPRERGLENKSVCRQFIRIVVGRISVWHSKHNTPNPQGVLPDAPISDHDKFDLRNKEVDLLNPGEM